MLYYLQTACIMIAMFHIWIQPYTDNFLNALDGVFLLALVLVVNINTFTFLSSATSVIIVILILFPMIAFFLVGSKRLISHILSRHQKRLQYVLIDDVDNDRENNMNNRKVC